MDYIDVYLNYFLVSFFWCFEDFRLTVFVRVPFFLFFSHHIHTIQEEIKKNTTGYDEFAKDLAGL